MDLNQFLSSSVTSSAGTPCISSNPLISSIPNRLFGSLKLDIGNSPTSGLSTHFDFDNLSSALSDSQEQYSSWEIHSGVNSWNSLLESNHYLHRPVSSVDHLQDIYLLGAFFHRMQVITMKTDMHCWNWKLLSWHLMWMTMSPRQPSDASDVEKHHQSMEEVSPQGFPSSHLKQLLIVCAKALTENNNKDFHQLIKGLEMLCL